MKKTAAFILTLVLLLTLSLNSFALANVTEEISNLRSYYAKRESVDLWEETLALASMGILTGRTPHLPEQDGTAGTLAKRILAVSATGNVPQEDSDAKTLKDLQNTDGSFGNVESHCLSMLALTAREELYNSAKAYSWLMTQQSENGSFSDSAKDTALAICILTRSENEAELAAAAKAVKYLNQYEAGNGIDLCWQIIGISDGGGDAATAGKRDLLENLLSYQNPSDYSFYRSNNDTVSDPQTTAIALIALDAVNKSGSVFQRLATDGEISFFNPADALPLLIFVGVVLVISIGFWCFIFLHKKNSKTLEETKTY